jgi:basic membrane lipoprotein Med (substrate-binding protein (PBP1-ABC) superfamily)
VALCAVLLLVGAACSSAPKTSSGTTASPTHKVLKVALVTPGDINDLSFNEGAYDPLKKLQDQGLIKLSYSARVPEDAASVTPVLEQYARQGNDLIIANSFGFGDPTIKVAKQFPQVHFIWQGAPGTFPPNMGIFVPPIWEAGYLAGILAGGVTKSGILGGLSGFDIPDCHATLVAYKLGAAKVRPGVKELTTYTGDWVDVAKSQAAAQAQANQGADVFASCGEGEALGSIAVAKAKNLTAVGYILDESPLAPKNIVASMVWNEYVPFKAMLSDIQNGTWKQSYNEGVKDGAIQVPINGQYEHPIPASVMTVYQNALSAIKSGSFTVPYVPK